MIELLIVVEIVAILASMLLPAPGKAKAAAQSIKCVNNLKQISLATAMYAGDYNDRMTPLMDLGDNNSIVYEEPFADTPEKKQERVERLRHAHSVQIDTGFAYYRNRSNESIASELRVNGFDGVYYCVISDRGIIPGLVGKIQRQNLTDPDVAIGLQADFGSQAATRRKPEWRETFLQACEAAGVATTTYYEFALRSEVFTAPPVLKELRRQGESLQLIFDQRLGSSSPEKMRQRPLTDESGRQYVLRHATLDGNILIATLSPIPSVGTVLRVPLGGLTDDPSVRFGVSADSEEIDQPANAIPENTVISLPVLPENQF